MTYEETIKTLTKAKKVHSQRAGLSFVKALDIAMTVIEKQIPKKPIWGGTSNISWRSCPECHSREYKTFKYCSQCGQALDWSDTE